MKHLNYALIYFKLLFLSFIFTIVLIYIIMYTYEMYLGLANLCDDNGLILSELKKELNNSISTFNQAILNKEMYYTSYERIINNTLFSIDIESKESALKTIEYSCNKMNESLERINSLEKSIKKLDPNFKPMYTRFPLDKYIETFNYYIKKA